jgi:hypothetical protein
VGAWADEARGDSLPFCPFLEDIVFLRSLVPLVALLPLTACLKLPTNDPIALCIEQQKIVCSFQYTCCDLDERGQVGFSFGLARNEAECNENGVHSCELFGSYTQISTDRGRARIDGDEAQRCLDQLRAARDSCDINALDDADCDVSLIGTVETGDTCISDSECSDGYCRIEYNSDGEPEDVDAELGIGEGKCVARAGNGDECSGDSECEEDLYCTDDGTCARLPGEGEPCESECQEGLSCEFDPNDPNAENDICVPSNDDDDGEDRNICGG